MIELLLAVALRIDTSHLLARFDPSTALGGTLDVHSQGETAKVLSGPVVDAMLSAGFHPLSYRLATELGGEAWHWNPRGNWSDGRQGYWTSSSDVGVPITMSYGYRLPRRGNTLDQALDDGYSRIDDGDPATFWKSNPYLRDRPQWILLDLGAARRVDRIDVTWGEPHATKFESQYWRGEDPINDPADGGWHRIAHPVTARYVRVWMTESVCGPAEAGPHTDDWRDRTGFAVREVAVRAGTRDLVRHAPDQTQTVVWVSSTDPWHRETDIDPSMEQPGLDAVFASRLTRGLPMLTPVALLYGTPEDAAAEFAYLRARKYAVMQIEMGEEPDGQNMAPEDYAALYSTWAAAIHGVDPSLQLGGPAFQSTRDVIAFWPDERGHTSWMARFLEHIDRRDFNFFSFEWYPFDNVCSANVERQLIEAPHVLDRVLGAWRREGVPQDIPWLATEYGWSSYAAATEVDMPAALFNAEFVADFLARGGASAYFYGYEPSGLFAEKCNQFGALTLFLGDERVPAFYAAEMVTKDWLQASGVHELYAVSFLAQAPHPAFDHPRIPLTHCCPSPRVRGEGGRRPGEGLRAYVVKRPDTSWSLLILNVARTSARVSGVDGDAVQYSPQQYEWRADGEQGHAIRNLPPRRFHAGGSIELPPWSITVVSFRAQD